MYISIPTSIGSKIPLAFSPPRIYFISTGMLSLPLLIASASLLLPSTINGVPSSRTSTSIAPSFGSYPSFSILLRSLSAFTPVPRVASSPNAPFTSASISGFKLTVRLPSASSKYAETVAGLPMLLS